MLAENMEASVVRERLREWRRKGDEKTGTWDILR